MQINCATVHVVTHILPCRRAPMNRLGSELSARRA